VLALALASCLPACATEPGTHSSAVRDSAGIRIVESTRALWDVDQDRRWVLSETPAVSIGSLEPGPDFEIFDVRGALRLRDGSLVVANAGTSQLLFFDSEGEFSRAVGQKGQGPGEFENLFYCMRFGRDSLLVWDGGNARMTVHDAEGAYVREFRLVGEGGAPLFPGMDPVVFADRTLLGMAMLPVMDQPEGLYRPQITYFRLGPAGDERGPFVTVPGNMFSIRYVGEDRRAMAPVLFGPEPVLAATDSLLWVGRGETFELEAYDLEGELRRLVRNLTYRASPITEAHIAAEIEKRLASMAAMLDRMGGDMAPGWAAAQERNIREMPRPEVFPPYARLLTDPDGNLWVMRYPEPGQSGSQWTVFDAEGRLRGTLELPDRFEPFDVGNDYILGRWRDELDVEYVRLYGLTRST
jgi:hypothetical protein